MQSRTKRWVGFLADALLRLVACLIFGSFMGLFGYTSSEYFGASVFLFWILSYAYAGARHLYETGGNW